ncbi:MAG: hypothetical protein KAU52_00905 [Methanosarcinales archaeon]|nr:hypothetical protein [Methanosarcinales archaeon]
MYKQITILTVLICFLAASAHAAQMSVEPVSQEAFQGDDITVNITVDPGDGEEVHGASYTLHFDNTILNATSFEKGPFLTQDGESSDTIATGINNTAGEIEYGEYRTSTYSGVTGLGVLTTITFQVIGDGISSLNLSAEGAPLYFINQYGISVPVPTTLNNGSVEVKKGIRGDVDGFEGITTNDGWMIFMNLTYKGDPRYMLTSTWAADCDGFEGVSTNDGWLIFMNLTYKGDPRYVIVD